jgi:hypothetical protein
MGAIASFALNVIGTAHISPIIQQGQAPQAKTTTIFATKVQAGSVIHQRRAVFAVSRTLASDERAAALIVLQRLTDEKE